MSIPNKLNPLYISARVKYEIQKKKNDKTAAAMKMAYTNDNTVSIIAQNCVGGVLYHDLGLKFTSPTINLYFDPKEFLKYVLNIKHYNALTPQMVFDEKRGYPVGKLEDISVYFMHYTTCEEAKQKWEERKARINYNKLFIIALDENHFGKECYELFKQIPYEKVLFTVDKKLESQSDCVYLDKITVDGKSYIIEERKFYKDGVLINKMNLI